MKKAYQLIFIVIFSTLAGCSKVEPDVTPDPDAWKYDLTLPVPIEMSTSGAGVMTKVGLPGTSMNGMNIGVFALDTASTVNWTKSGSESVLFQNISATVTDDENGVGRFSFNPIQYYPMSGGQNFTFFAYYPTTDDNLWANFSTGNSAYKKTYTLGYTDILHAKSIASTLTFTDDDGDERSIDGFNAAYIRRIHKEAEKEDSNLNIDDYLPQLEFKHVTTALTFKLRANKEDFEDLKGHNVTVTGLTIKDTYKTAALNVADKNNGGKVGMLEGGDKGDIKLRAGNNSSGAFTFGINFNDVDLDNAEFCVKDFRDATDVELGLLLAPHPTWTDSDGSEKEGYKAMLHISADTGSGTKTWDVPLVLEDPVSGKNFEPGKKYTFTLLIKSPQEITGTAVLSEWEEVIDDTPIDCIN